MTYKEEYIDYIDTHVENVQKAFDWLLKHHIDDKVDFGNIELIKERLKDHDKSKWSDIEFEPYAQHFYTDKGIRADYEKAWNHHQKTNPHHWQYWVLIRDDPDNKFVYIPMEIEYIVEMICDWWSFSFKENKLEEVFSWYDNNKENQLMHPETRKTVEAILDAIKEELKMND